MQYITLKPLYLTFLTHNDSYMEEVPEGSILTLTEQGDFLYNGKISIDGPVWAYLKNNYIQDYIG